MDQDDPEKRIAELERQLAEQKHMAELGGQQAEPVNSPTVTPEDVHSVGFSKPPIGQRGYNEDEVDHYLDLIEATLRDPTASGGVTPADIHNVAFSKPPIGKRGYNEDEVDAFLDCVEIELTRRADRGSQQGAFPPPPQAGFPPPPAGWEDVMEQRRLAALSDPWPGQKTRFRRIISWFINAELESRESRGTNSAGG